MEEYRLLELPVLKDPFEEMMESLSSSVYTSSLKSELGPFYNDYMKVQSILEWEGVQARMLLEPILE